MEGVPDSEWPTCLRDMGSQKSGARSQKANEGTILAKPSLATRFLARRDQFQFAFSLFLRYHRGVDKGRKTWGALGARPAAELARSARLDTKGGDWQGWTLRELPEDKDFTSATSHKVLSK